MAFSANWFARILKFFNEDSINLTDAASLTRFYKCLQYSILKAEVLKILYAKIGISQACSAFKQGVQKSLATSTVYYY